MTDKPNFQIKIDALADELDADILVYLGEIKRGEDDYIIDQCRKRRLRTNVLLILTTYGGDPNAGYRIGRCLQQAYRTALAHDKRPGEQEKKGEFLVYIDNVCKSAGTLICLGADKLIMAGNAELGPLDTQLRKQDEVGERTSGLTPIQAVQFLETQSVLLYKRHFKSLRFSDDMIFSTKMASDVATQLTTGLLQPIYQQLDPLRLAEVDRSLRIAKEYGERIKTNNLQDDEVLDKLIAKYPSHGFVIDRTEAKTLFKNVDKPTKRMREIYDLFRPLAKETLAKDEQSWVYFVSTEPPESQPQDKGEQSHAEQGKNG